LLFEYKHTLTNALVTTYVELKQGSMLCQFSEHIVFVTGYFIFS